MNTLIIGDSHGIFLARHFGWIEGVWDKRLQAPLAIRDAQGSHRADFVLLNPQAQVFQSLRSDAGEVTTVAPAFAQQLVHHDREETTCFALLHGNDHNGRFMLQHEVPFDFVCPHVPDQLALGRQIIPRAVMLRQLTGSALLVAHKLHAIQMLLPRARTVLVLPPPPNPGGEHILRHPEAFDFQQHVLEDKWVRLKIHHAYAELLRNVATQLGVPVLGTPAGAIDADGFLAPTHWQGATHAAPSYYALLLQEHGLAQETPGHASLQIAA